MVKVSNKHQMKDEFFSWQTCKHDDFIVATYFHRLAYSNLKSTLAEEIEVSQNDSFEIATGELKTTVVSKNEELYSDIILVPI